MVLCRVSDNRKGKGNGGNKCRINLRGLKGGRVLNQIDGPLIGGRGQDYLKRWTIKY